MSSAGQAIGAVIGAAAGFFFGPPGWATVLQGASYGLAIGGYLDPPKGQDVIGPRLNDLSSQSGSYSIAIPRVYGSISTYGNIFWLENNKLKEVVTKTKQKSGGKGGGSSSTTVTTYSYFATFAVGLCEGPITGIRRIWIGSKLFYDSGSDDLATIIASNNNSNGFTLYTGTDTQIANYRIQAEHGTSTPAYRGLAYIVFYDFALKEYGNSMMGMQVKVEVVNNTVTQTVTDKRTYIGTSSHYMYPSISYMNSEYVEICQQNSHGWENSTTVTFYRVYLLTGVVTKEIVSRNNYAGNFSTHTRDMLEPKNIFNLPNMVFPNSTNLQFGPSGNMLKYNDIFVVGAKINSSNYYNASYRWVWVSSPDEGIHEIALNTTSEGYIQGVTTDGTYVYAITTTKIYKFDLRLNIIEAYNHGIYIPDSNFEARLRIYDGYLYYNIISIAGHPFYRASLSNISQWNHWSIGSIVPAYSGYYSTDYYITGNLIVWAAPEWLGSDGGGGPYCNILIGNNNHTNLQSLPLSTVINKEVNKSLILNNSDINTLELSSQVTGYRISTLSSLRTSIEPLQGAYPFDVYQQGYKIKFKPRGGSSVVTIPENTLGATVDSTGKTIRLTETREMTIQLPKSVSLKFFDTEREYDQGEQVAERITSLSANKLVIELPLAMTSTQALQKAEILLYLYWMEKSEFSFTLPPVYNYLEPSDIITISTTLGNMELRLIGLNYLSNGIIECKAKPNKSSTYTSIASGESGQSTGATIKYEGEMLSILMDLPCVTSDLNTPAYIVAAYSMSPYWSGGVLYSSNDNEQTWESVQGFSVSNTIGIAESTPIAWDSTLVDYTSKIIYKPLSGDTLESITFDQLLNNNNIFAYGTNGRWEIIGAANCILQGDGTYILSNLLRGRAGTEHNTNNHQIGDYLVLLDEQPPIISVESSIIGSTGYSYRSATVGTSIESASNNYFTYSGTNLECLSPVYIRGSYNLSNSNWDITWIRRNRISGEWRDYVDTPNSETSESYEIDIYSDNYISFKRTIYSNTPSVTYTLAEQTTDFGATSPIICVKVYQMSSIVGRGIAGTTKFIKPGYYWEMTTALLHLNGTIGSSAFIDEKGHSFSGNATLIDTNAIFGTTCANFNGGHNIVFPSHSDYNSYTDFTIEWWFTGNPSSKTMFSTNPSNIIFAYSNIYVGGGNVYITLPTSGTHHYCISRFAGVVYIFVDGILQTTFWGPNTVSFSNAEFGRYVPNGDNYLTGQIDEIRLSKLCRYTTSFSVQTTPFDIE